MPRDFALQVDSYERPSPPPEKPMLYASDEEKVEYLYLRNWRTNRIARKLKLSPYIINGMCEAIDAKIEKRVREAPERIRAQHFGFHEELAGEAMKGYAKTKRSEDGPDPRFLRVAAENKAAARKIYGLDAATKTENVNLTARAVFTPEEMARIWGNPETRRAMTMIEMALGDGEPVIDATPIPAEGEPSPGGAP
jgi:hypothetical protein